MRLPEGHLVPPSFAWRASSADDPRLGDLIARTTDGDDVAAMIVGFPVDEGVRRNGGRPGAADGPDAIRPYLYKMTPAANDFDRHVATLERLVDLGNVDVTDDLERDQEALGEVVAWILDRGAIPIILGGGHETAYGHYLGYASRGVSPCIINWDAHADVRPLKNKQAHSGSPFRQAIEHPAHPCSQYFVAGLQPSSVSRDHLHFVEAHAGRSWFVDEIDPEQIDFIYSLVEAPAMVTMDLDAVDQASAPGVSAPAVNGISPRHWLLAARRAGASPAVSSFDLSELNPRFDVDGRTVRLAARTVWEFVRALAERG